MTGNRHVALALQGGGAHGAFTWGVLDRLLDEPLTIRSVSGTSAGALNGAALVAGLAEDGSDGARRVLERLWRSVSSQSPLGVMDLPVHWPFAPMIEKFVERALETAKLTTRYIAPHLPGVGDMTPLRRVVSGSIDLERLSDPTAIPLHVAATRIADGQARLFTGGAITLDALMASACLPDLFSAVHIDGVAYWDGGFSANPALEPLVFSDDEVTDLLVVQVTPFAVEPDIDTLGATMRRMSDISFNACLMRDLKSLAEIQRLARKGTLEHDRLCRLRIHLLAPSATLPVLGSASKLDTRRSTLDALREEGWRHMDDWLRGTGFDGALEHADQVVA